MLEDLRAALEDARPAEYNVHAHMVGMNDGGMPRRALGIEEIEAVAATARDKGHQDGYQQAQLQMRPHQERALVCARREGETLGGLAGISTSIGALQRRREGLREAKDMELVVGTLSSAIDELEALYDALNLAGMHGERQRGETDDARTMGRVG